jgi:rhodanese-related sulfurtransferase
MRTLVSFSISYSMFTLTSKELAYLLEKSPETIDLIDVRGTGEYAESHIPEARNIPLHLLPMRMSEIDTTKQVIFICRSGGRSGQATSFAETAGIK